MDLSVGDVVRHRVLGSEKIIVGISSGRYLCASCEDVLEDGRLRPEARVALHHRESLDKIGRHGTVVTVNLHQLCEKEFKEVHRLRRRNIFREEVIPYSLFLLASILIVLGILSGLEGARAHIEATFFRKVEEKKIELRREAGKVHQNGIDAEEIKKPKRILGQ